MESLVIPILILAIVAAGVSLAARAISRRSGATRPSPETPGKPHSRKHAVVTDQREMARQASAKLSQEQHRRIYALIAQGQAVSAIKAYNESTGQGLRAARDAVVALAAHPQPPQVQLSAPQQEADTDEKPARFPYRYRAIASRGNITREISSNMLNDEIYSRIKDMARNGDPDAAAVALARHSDVSLAEAREFAELLID